MTDSSISWVAPARAQSTEHLAMLAIPPAARFRAQEKGLQPLLLSLPAPLVGATEVGIKLPG